MQNKKLPQVVSKEDFEHLKKQKATEAKENFKTGKRKLIVAKF